MATRRAFVNWLSRAREGLPNDFVKRLEKELQAVFPEARSITVCDQFHGYTNIPERKIVLGVEVRAPESYSTHVVKIGATEEVLPDYEGWRACTAKRLFASRIFLPVTKTDLRGDRAAVRYENAYVLFGPNERLQSPVSLEDVVSWTVKDDKPDPRSVERVIRQIYTDLGHWFYDQAKDDPKGALDFYRRRVRKATGIWRTDQWRHDLRRDIIWLLAGEKHPKDRLLYLDPCDFVCWACHTGTIPHTLVGRSHGDLHGRNILVGVQRGEAEYPTVFDYGEMSSKNVIAWDFVKLETELKTRLLLDLFKDESVRGTLRNFEEDGAAALTDGNGSAPGRVIPRRILASMLRFVFQFESLLADLTAQIYRLDAPESTEPLCSHSPSGNEKLDRALCILLRIRREAALALAEVHTNVPHELWREEYNFALAVYAVSTGKFNYREYESAFALISGGVAAARLDMAQEAVLRQINAKRLSLPTRGAAAHYPYPSYHVPMIRAHRLWAGKHSRQALNSALEALEHATQCYEHAVPLLQEQALLLAEAGRHAEGQDLLRPLQALCEAFGDFETLCRIARLAKDFGDIALDRDPVPIDELPSHPAAQEYNTAYDVYMRAFKLRKDYYPGVNAATLGIMLAKPTARDTASEVARLCQPLRVGSLPQSERFWVFATEGECALLLGKSKEAARFYRQALAVLGEKQVGMAQSAYNQVCRLYWALGEQRVTPVTRVFKTSHFWSNLAAGPLGNCDFDE